MSHLGKLNHIKKIKRYNPTSINLSGVRYCTVAYTGLITFHKVTETHGHVLLVTLYLIGRISIMSFTRALAFI